VPACLKRRGAQASDISVVEAHGLIHNKSGRPDYGQIKSMEGEQQVLIRLLQLEQALALDQAVVFPLFLGARVAAWKIYLSNIFNASLENFFNYE